MAHCHTCHANIGKWVNKAMIRVVVFFAFCIFYIAGMTYGTAGTFQFGYNEWQEVHNHGYTPPAVFGLCEVICGLFRIRGMPE